MPGPYSQPSWVRMNQIATARSVMYTRESGSSTFQPSAMSWSYRKRGSVHRTQTYVKRNTKVLKPKTTSVANVFRTLGSPVESHAVNRMAHPPTNRVAIKPEPLTMFEYSAIYNI